MSLMPLIGRLMFLLGGFVLLVLGLMVMDRTWMMVFPMAGIYFVARGACFVGATLINAK